MALIGLQKVTFGLLDSNNKLLTGTSGLSTNGLFEVTNDMLGTKQANISNLAGSVTAIYGNNGQTGASAGSPTPSVAFSFNALPFAIKEKILGRVKETGAVGYSQLASTNIPHVAVLIHTNDFGDGSDTYYGFNAGIFTETAQNIGTNTNTDNIVTDDLTYTARSTDNWNGKNIKFYNSADTDFSLDTMLAEVFTGYVAATGTGVTEPAI
jgi:phi13 family phage major tail protein